MDEKSSVKTFFRDGNFGIVNITFGEKSGRKSKLVEKTYVNQNVYESRKIYGENSLWKNLWKVWKTHIYQQK